MNTMVLQFMLEGLRCCTILCFNVYTTIEYLNKNVSIGQLIQHIPNSIVVCAGSTPKGQTKTYNKEVRFHNHCLYYGASYEFIDITLCSVTVSLNTYTLESTDIRQ